MSEIKDLFFDLDNTILDFSYASHIAFQELLNQFGLDATQNSYYKLYNEGNHEVWKDFEDGKISALRLRSERFERFFKKIKWEGDGLEWNRIYIENIVNNTKFVDGALEMTKELSKLYSIHIVTNGLREAQRPRIREAALEDFLNSITVSDEIGIAKPHQDFFKTAMENAKISDKSSILMIGDSYRSDITGGNNFGLKTCWFNHDKKEMDPKMHDFEIHHISDLEKILL